MNLQNSRSAISSPGSACGPMQRGAQDGGTTSPCGPDPVHASLSAQPENKKDFPTTDTSGPSGVLSLNSANLQSLLESKLRRLSTGSILYRLTWKNRATPSGRLICAQRASGARISASDYILSGWPTPHQNSTTGAGTSGREGGLNIQTASQLAGWPTTTTRDHKDGDCEGTVEINALLGRSVWLAGWPTPMAAPTSEASHGQSSGQYRRQMQEMAPDFGQPMRLCSDRTLLIGSTAGMASGGRLNPAHSRWLMRLPPVWDDCAPTETRSTRKRQRNSSVPSKKPSPIYDL